jgi:hypothetical protein
MAVLDADEKTQDDLRALFADGPAGMLAWLNLCGWTYNPRDGRRYVPFATWAVQDRAAEAVFSAVEGGSDVLIDKSRDMGATWLNLAVLAWWWLFVPDTPLLIASRKEEYVDARGNPDTLFWKLDCLVDRLPSWLRPQSSRRHMHLENEENGSVIDGESTNGDLGRGGRRRAILLDEFAAVDNGREILAATADASPCRIFNSTPKGRANAFADVRFSGRVRVVTLHWKDHPEKGRDAEHVEIDGRRTWTSPWYRRECQRRTSRREIAQELDIDYLASGEAFFDLDVLGRLRASNVLREPMERGELDVRFEETPAGRARLASVRFAPDGGRRRLSLWLRPETPAPHQPPHGSSRRLGELPPPQRYVAFADVAHGSGSSNSVIKVASADTREEVASFVSADTPPHELAREAVALCGWFSAPGRPTLLGWEANGPGGIFALEVRRLGWPHVLEGGWVSSRQAKELLLGRLRRALARGELTLRDERTVVEAEQYVYFASGAIGPSVCEAEPGGARSPHGDRVIAAAGLLLCLEHAPPARAPVRAAPPGSFAARRRPPRPDDAW